MNFSDAAKVSTTIHASDDVCKIRSENRAKINDAANGVPPLSIDDAKRLGVEINVNWLELAILLLRARIQYNNAYLNKQRFFKVSIPSAPAEKRDAWETFITRKINKVLKRSLPFIELNRSKFASVACHGIGPQVWYGRESWLPKFVPLEDFRVPTDTVISFENLEWFACRHNYTEGELAQKVFGKNASKHWKKPIVAQVLKEYHEDNSQSTTYDWVSNPEKMHELIKQNAGFYASDAVPSIPLWHFFFRDEKGWKLRVVPDLGVKGEVSDSFLYDSGAEIYAEELSHILHCQFGDLSNKAPFLFHSVRSLGFLLMEPCHWNNIRRCRFMQHVMESFNIWIRSDDPQGRSRAQKIELFNKAIIPPGVGIVPNTERHHIDPAVLDRAAAELKQLMGEASSSYVQDVDNGTAKEQTAFETMVKLHQANAMVTGILGTSFTYASFEYEEICRRFCLRKTGDTDAAAFQKACKEFGIPAQYINVELWDVDPEIPMGAGNPTMEIAQAKEMLGLLPMLDGTAQRIVIRNAVTAFMDDPRAGEQLVPDKGRGVTDGQRDAQSMFGTLMQGVPVPPKEGLPQADQIETLLLMFQKEVDLFKQTGNVCSIKDAMGLNTVGTYISALLQPFAQNPSNKQKAKTYSENLMRLMNEAKGFMQRAVEKEQSSQQNPEAQAKVQATILQAKTKAQLSEEAATQKLKHKEAAFQTDQQRKNLQTAADQHRKNAQVAGDESRKNISTAGEIQRQDAKLEAAPVAA